MELIAGRLAQLATGSGTTIVVEGGAGIGKSRLLEESMAAARRLGIKIGASTAELSESAVELSALLSAMFRGNPPLFDRHTIAARSIDTDSRFWLLRDLEALLARKALTSPLMICIDDVQWVDAGTAAALRTLPVRLRDVPIAWVVAARPMERSSLAARALDQLTGQSAEKIVLGPLEPSAAVSVGADLLGGRPGRNVLALIDELAGNPFLLVEMLRGLSEEQRVEIRDGNADVADTRMPRRVQEKMRERLARLPEQTREVAVVAASLGRSFSVDDVAHMLERSSSSLLVPVGELLTAELFIEQDGVLRFWHDLTREAVRGSVPLTARRALDRQAAGILLKGGALPVEVAGQLAASAEVGDEVAIATLLEAAKALVTSDPATAAQFGQRALEIASLDHPQRGDVVSTAAIALHIAGESEEAIAFADRALRETLPGAQEAEVRLSIAGMFAISPEIRIAAGRVALALPDLSEAVRARHLACLFHNLVTAGRLDEARTTLKQTRAAVESADDARSSFTFCVAESALEYAEGRFGRSLELIASARRAGIAAGDDQRLRLAQMWHGELLSFADRYDDALAIAAEGLDTAQRDRQGWAYQMFETWHGRMLLRTGRLTEALAVLEQRFAFEDGSRAAAVLDAAGIAALGRLSVHTGDRRLARRLRDVGHVMLEQGTPAVRRHAGWLLTLLSIGDGDYDGARAWLLSPNDPGGRPTMPRFPLDISDVVVIARVAIETADAELAQMALSISQRRAELNSDLASIAASAAHVRGLLNRSDADLREAVERFEHTPRRLELAGALEDLGVISDREVAIDALDRSLTIFTEIRASWDARRVSLRLREHGVRRRPVTHEVDETAWETLTSSERGVAQLVAEGLTNREVADRLFLSVHTVNSHLRHTFVKLGINSRVELARLGREAASS